MEATCGVGCWSGAQPSQALINSVSSHGFNVVRIPCAWNFQSDANGNINATFMSQVKQIVDWCYAKGLYVIINDHWDNGWFENNAFASFDSTINGKLQHMWQQIASTFATYDSHLLFAAANEPNASTQAQTNVLFQYYQTFVNTVRAGGGNNTTRWLLVQGPSTNIDYSYNYTLNFPTDSANRTMLEVHWYDPYQFSQLTADASWGNMFYFWGSGYHSATLPSRNATWGEEPNIQAEFDKMKTKFVNAGRQVLIGEWLASPKPSEPDLTGANITLNYASVTYWNKYVHDQAASRGIYQTCWNINGNCFDYATGNVTDQNMLNSCLGTAALPPPGGTDFALSANPSSLSIKRSSSKTTTIQVTPSGGFTGTVALSASGLPSGVTASFNPTSTTSTSVLTITVNGSAAYATSTVTITGTSGTLTHTLPFSVTVSHH